MGGGRVTESIDKVTRKSDDSGETTVVNAELHHQRVGCVFGLLAFTLAVANTVKDYPIITLLMPIFIGVAAFFDPRNRPVVEYGLAFRGSRKARTSSAPAPAWYLDSLCVWLMSANCAIMLCYIVTLMGGDVRQLVCVLFLISVPAVVMCLARHASNAFARSASLHPVVAPVDRPPTTMSSTGVKHSGVSDPNHQSRAEHKSEKKRATTAAAHATHVEMDVQRERVCRALDLRSVTVLAPVDPSQRKALQRLLKWSEGAVSLTGSSPSGAVFSTATDVSLGQRVFWLRFEGADGEARVYMPPRFLHAQHLETVATIVGRLRACSRVLQNAHIEVCAGDHPLPKKTLERLDTASTMLLEAARHIIGLRPLGHGALAHIVLHVADAGAPARWEVPSTQRAFGTPSDPGAFQLRFQRPVDEHTYAHLYTSLSFYLQPLAPLVAPGTVACSSPQAYPPDQGVSKE
jgi:hypothetical protein